MTEPRDPARVPSLTEQAQVGWWRLVPLPLAMSAMLAATACSNDATGPTPVEQPVIKPDPILPDGGSLSGLVADAMDRVMPYMPEGPTREEVRAALAQLALSVETKAVSSVQLALATASAAIARYETLVAGDHDSLAELGGIRLTLDLIAAQAAAVAGN